MLFPLRRGSLPSSFFPLIPSLLLSSSLPANPHGAQPGTRTAGPKRESASSRGPLPKSCSPVWALDTLSPSPSILPLLLPGRGNAGPSASGGCTPKRYWPCICPRCALITSQGFFGCAREKLPIARLWADANSPGQLSPKAGRGWWQVTFAPRRFRKKIQGKLRKSQVPWSYNINTAILLPSAYCVRARYKIVMCKPYTYTAYCLTPNKYSCASPSITPPNPLSCPQSHVPELPPCTSKVGTRPLQCISPSTPPSQQ